MARIPADELETFVRRLDAGDLAAALLPDPGRLRLARRPSRRAG